MPLDKRAWRPSVLPGQVVLVSTIGPTGEPNVAPKSWITMVAFEGPVLGFGCNVDHLTYRNIEATGDFVVNVPDRTLAPTVWELIETRGAERLHRAGLRLVPASSVRAPLVADCRAHLECRYLRSETFGGGEVFIFGTVVAAAIDAACTVGDDARRYRELGAFFFLETGLFAGLDQPTRLAPPHRGP